MSKLRGNPHTREAWIRGDQDVLNLDSYTNEAIESGHSWVQRMFPMLIEPLSTNKAVVPEDINAIREIWGDKLPQIFDRNLSRFAKFLAQDPRAMRRQGETHNHNEQRITRMLISSVDFGFPELALKFWRLVGEAYQQRAALVPRGTYEKYWRPVIERAKTEIKGAP